MKKKNSIKLLKGLLPAVLWVFSFAVFAQPITVSGTVYDTSGGTLVGVTLQVQGTSVGTVTDLDGNFRLTNVNPNASL
jgi:iron complex outermembrane receptor protein